MCSSGSPSSSSGFFTPSKRRLSSASEAFESGEDLSEVLAKAASSARTGAVSTAAMRPSAGRARYAPDAAVGSVDPGASTVALIFEAWADELNDEVMT